MTDTRCTNIILQSMMIPSEYHTPSTQIAEARQMDENFYKYDISVKDIYFYFQTNNSFSSTYYMPKIYIIPIRFQLILGLDFLLTCYHGMLLTRNGITFLKEEIVPITSNINTICDKSSPCKCKTIEHLDHEVFLDDNEINLENNELEICTEYINNMHIYNLLETGIYEMDTLISKLEKLEIIGENPTIH